MKTAISIPDELFKNVEKIARKLKIPKSQLFARAMEEYISKLNKDQITERLNKIYQRSDSDEILATDISISTLRKSLKNDSW
jgi:metal-responsive CopG/Arc/MetJ family transcriptional regulator